MEDTVRIDGISMDYVVFGKGTRPLVLIPGLSVRRVKGSGAALSLMYRIFSKEYKVYVFDRKDEIPEDYSIEEIADDTAKVMEHLGLFHSYVFGVSQGGMIAQYMAVKYPHLVDKLVLAVTAARVTEQMKEGIYRWISLSKEGDAAGFVEDMLYSMYSESYMKRYRMMIPLMKKTVAAADGERFIRLAKSCLTCNIIEEIDKITCPVFVIGGGKDKIVSPEASVEIAQRLQCDFYMYNELGHAAYEEAKDFNKRVYDWLKNES